MVAVDDDPAKLNQTIHGVPVKGTLEDPGPVQALRHPQHHHRHSYSEGQQGLNHVIDLCVSTHCAVQMLSDPQLVGSGTPQQGAFRELNPAGLPFPRGSDAGYRSDLRLPHRQDRSGHGRRRLHRQRTVPSGDALQARQAAYFDIYENCAYELLMELQQKYGRDIPVTVLIGSIRDKKRLDEVFET